MAAANEMYQDAKIFRILCEDGSYYIGSTTQEINARLNYIKQQCTSLRSSTAACTNALKGKPLDTMYAVLIEEFPCDSKRELNRRVEELLEEAKEDPQCLNHDMKTICQTGKIYRIQCGDGKYYIGSTILTLPMRMTNHKSSCKKETGTSPFYLHMRTLGWDNATIELLENYPCNNHVELKAREDHHLRAAKDDPQCLNLNRSNVEHEERKENMRDYYQANHDHLLQKAATYREQNHEVLAVKQAEHRAANREVLNQKQKEYAARNHETVTEYQRTYREANRDILRERYRVQREKIKADPEKAAKNKAAKLEWQRNDYRKKADAVREQKQADRAAKKAETEAKEKEVHDCPCGGSYQWYHRNRHMNSKMHRAHQGNMQPPSPRLPTT